MLSKFLSHRIQLVYSFLHQITMAVYGFGLLFLILRILPQNEVGRWMLFISTLSIADMLLHGFLQTILVKEYAKNSKNSKMINIIRSHATVLAILVFIGIFLLTLISKFGFYLNHKQYTLLNDFFKWYPLLGILMVIYNLSWWLNTGINNFKRILIQRLIFCLISISFILFEYFNNHPIGFDTLVISQVLGYTSSSIYSIFANHFTFTFRYVHKDTLVLYAHYGKYTLGTMLGSSLLRNSDTFMIAAFIDTKSVAIYVLAQKIIEIFEVILRSMASTLLPTLYQLKENIIVFYKSWFITSTKLTLLFLPLSILVFIFSDTVIFWISGSDSYNESSFILRIFMVYVLLLPLDRLIGIALEILSKPHWNLIKTVVLTIINIAGNYVTLYYFHSLGAAAAVSSLALCFSIIAGFYFLKKSGLPPYSMLNLKFKDIKPKLVM